MDVSKILHHMYTLREEKRQKFHDMPIHQRRVNEDKMMAQIEALTAVILKLEETTE